MTRRFLALAALAGCVTPYERVKDLKTIEAARAELGRTQLVAINQFPPNGEAWYFDWQHCVLYVDGKFRMSMAITQTGKGPKETVECSPEAAARHDERARRH